MELTVKKGIKISGACLFCIYFTGLVYALFFAESYGRGMDGSAYNCNIYPFREIFRYLTCRDILGTRAVLLNLGGNILGFVPFGALLPIMARGVRRFWKVGLLSFEISALVEISQLIFQVGCFDVDDMILNMLGGLIGYGIFCLSGIGYYRMSAGWKNRKER